MYRDFLDFLKLLISDRKAIIKYIIAFTIIAIVMSFIIPSKYKATTTLMPPIEEGSNLLGLAMGMGLVSSGGVGGVGYMPGMVTPSDVYGSMIKSRTVEKIVIGKCNLIEHYKKSKQYIKNKNKTEDIIHKKLSLSTEVAKTDQEFITITVEDKNPEKAAEIANTYVEALNQVNSTINMGQGRKAREFIDRRIKEEELLLMHSEDSLKNFQIKHKTVYLPEETKAAIELAAQIEAKNIGLRIKLEELRTYFTDENPQIISLKNEINKSENELRKITNSGQNNLFIPFAKVPDISLVMGRLMRAVKLHEEVYALLAQQLEQAKILEAKDTPIVQTLELAYVPTHRSWPKRKLLVIFGFIIGIMVGVGNTMLQRKLNDLRKDETIITKVYEIITPLQEDINKIKNIFHKS
jgi:uncharacterized protein involved in exopolysaccharide biosynthesis